MPHTGRCLCGTVRYEIDGDLPRLVNCHCQFCRRAHGAAFVTVGWFPATSFRFTSGEESVHRYTTGGAFRCFCSLCGTRLYNGLSSGTGFISLIVSTLDEEPPAPVLHMNVESKAPWYEIDDDLPQHQGLPPQVIEALEKIGRSASREEDGS